MDCWVCCNEHIPQRTATESREDLPGPASLRQQSPAAAGVPSGRRAAEQPIRPLCTARALPNTPGCQVLCAPGSHCLAVAVERPRRLLISCFCAARCDHQTTTSRPGPRLCQKTVSNTTTPPLSRRTTVLHEPLTRSSFQHPRPRTRQPARRNPRSPGVLGCLAPAVQCAQTANVSNAPKAS